jgi:hypothetical protein
MGCGPVIRIGIDDLIARQWHQRIVDLHRFRSGQVLMLGGPLFEGHG